MASSGFETSFPGASTPSPNRSAAAANSANGFIPKRSSTSTVRMAAPPSSSTAFTICTHVVAIMPPNSTYAIIAAPTIAIATS
jgi:hypothetical protein